MNRYLFLAIACMSGIVAYSQNLADIPTLSPNRLVPGYVVLNDGDTLTGKIHTVGYQTAPEYVFFSDEKSATRRFSVDECAAFGNEDGVYERWSVKMEMSFMNRIDYIIHNEDSTLLDTVFLKRAYNGTTFSLYKYYRGNESGFLKAEDEKMHFFIHDKRNGTMQELILKFRNPYKGTTKFTTVPSFRDLKVKEPVNIYRDQLLAYFGLPTGKLRKKIERVAYTENDLSKILKELNTYIDKLPVE